MASSPAAKRLISEDGLSAGDSPNSSAFHTPCASSGSDDDDDLPSMSDVLCSPSAPVTPAKTRATASAASQALAEKLCLSPLTASPIRANIRQPCVVNAKYSVANLIKSHSKKKEMMVIDEDLRRQVQKGGLLKMTDAEAGVSAELPEHLELENETVEKLTNDGGVNLPDFPPSEEIFARDCAVAEPPTLSPTPSFEPNEWEKLLCLAPSKVGIEMVSLNLFKLAYADRPCPPEVFSWQLKTLAVHPVMHVAGCALETVCALCKKWSNADSPCMVEVDHVAWVLKAYGATGDQLLAGREEMDVKRSALRNHIMTLFPAACRKRKHTEASSAQTLDNLVSYHFTLLFKALAVSLETNPSFYTLCDLETLLFLLMRINLDTLLNACSVPLSTCLAWLLEAVPEERLGTTLSILRDVLLDVTAHHHQMHSIAQLLPPTPRARRLQKLYCYRCLFDIEITSESLSTTNPLPARIKCPPSVQLNAILGLIRSWKVGPNYTTDYYALHSAVLLLDLCVASDMLTPKAKTDVQVLMQVLNQLKHDIRDLNGVHLDRMKVKDLLMRLHVRYDIWLRSQETAEAKVSDYFNRRTSTDEALNLAEEEDPLKS